MSLQRTVEINLTSAGAAVPSATIRAASSNLEVHVMDAPAALIQVWGGANAIFAEMNLLRVQTTPGDQPATTLAAGYYKITECPQWVAVQVAIDGGAPRAFRVALKFEPKE